MPTECPAEVTAFVLSWLYHEPTKLELSDDPANLDFLSRIKIGAEFLGIEELQSHVEIVIGNIRDGVVVKHEIDDDDDELTPTLFNGEFAEDVKPGTKRRSKQSLPYQVPVHTPKRRGRPPKRLLEARARDTPEVEKRLVVSLRQITPGNDDAAANGESDSGEEDSTHDSGVGGEAPEDSAATSGANTATSVVKTELDVDGDASVEKPPKVKKPTVVKKTPSDGDAAWTPKSTTMQKRRKRRKFLLSNPPCSTKEKEKRARARTERGKELVTCEYCGREMTRVQLTQHKRNKHRYQHWKKKVGPINDSGKF